MLWWRPLGGDRDQGGRDGWCWHCTGPASAHQPPSFSSLSGFWPAQHGTEPTKGVNKISRQFSKKSWSGILKPPMNILSICITQISFLIPGRDSVYMPISNSVLWDLWVQQQYLILVVVRCFQPHIVKTTAIFRWHLAPHQHSTTHSANCRSARCLWRRTHDGY